MPQKQKTPPMRMCVVCREMKPKRELTRIVRPQEGEVTLDLTGRAPGRGAYICHSPECLKKARKSDLLARVLERKTAADLYDRLETLVSEDEKE